MNKRNLWILVGLIVVAIIVYFYIYSNKSNPAPLQNATPTQQDKNDLIQVNSLRKNDVVKSPLTLTGKARGYWYFEASFPIRIRDANGKILGTGIAQAEEEWMTTDFVPFSTTITFTKPTTKTGTVVFEKDNPSGLTENDDSFVIPVTFAE